MKRSWAWLAFGAALGALFVAERRRPLRRQVEPGPARVGRNLAIGLLAGATTAASEFPVIAPVQRLAERGRLGLLRQIGMPRALRTVLGFLLLDYTLYLWHRWNHRAPLLWRFHAVHHVDLDLDTTTGLRFHAGELTLAAGFRAAQVLLLGVDRETLRLWQQMLVVSVVFHHSNLELPVAVEKRLNAIVVTPRMHGIHHSTRPADTDSNYSSLLSCWDRLHRSFRNDVPQDQLTIGVAGFSSPAEVTLERSLTLPFREDPRLRPAGATRRSSLAEVTRALVEDPASRVTLTKEIAARAVDPDLVDQLIAYARSRQTTMGQALARKVLTDAGVSWEAL